MVEDKEEKRERIKTRRRESRRREATSDFMLAIRGGLENGKLIPTSSLFATLSLMCKLLARYSKQGNLLSLSRACHCPTVDVYQVLPG